MLAEYEKCDCIHPSAEVMIQIGDLCFDRTLSVLLHGIDETGSVETASEQLQIASSTAWDMVNQAEGCLLVCCDHGCGLSEKGRNLLHAYDCYREAVRQKAAVLYEEMF